MKPSHEIEKIRDEEFDDTLEEFFDEDSHYTKHMLENLVSKYRKVVLPHTKNFQAQVTNFFNVIEELQKRHETLVKNMKRRAKRTTKNTIGNAFKDGFLHKDTGLLSTYRKYFDALNKLMPPLKKKIHSSKELFQLVLVLNSEQRDDETLLSLVYRPMTRLLSLIHNIEEFIFLLSGICPLEVDKLEKTRNALLSCFLKGQRSPAQSNTPDSSPSTSPASKASPPLATKVTPPKTLLGKRGSPPSENKSPPKATVRSKVVPAKVPRISVHLAPDNPKKTLSSAIPQPTNYNHLAVPPKRAPKKR